MEYTNDRLMDLNDVASYVGLSAFTVRRLAKEGRIPAAKIGRAYRFKKLDIDTFLRNQYNTQKTGV